ncbi:translation elongation factor-like protein [Candidatus Woesearchaeota archaeon]|nr:translation elongation factor-like protein [Candidatus Woesearchaeota archaeon]
MEEKEIGIVKDFFVNVSVAAIELSDTIKVGDKIHIKGHTTDIIQKVDSMQINRKEIKEASSGDSVGIKVKDRVRHGDKVYKQ